MKIVSNNTWNTLIDLIAEKDEQIRNLENICERQNNLIEAQRRFISAHVMAQDIDFPNSERKGVDDCSDIFLL